MEFPQFLEKYYLHSQIQQLTNQLNELGIYMSIAETIREFYVENPERNVDDFHTQLILTISEFVTITNNALAKVKNLDEKFEYQESLTYLSVYLIKETYQISQYSKSKYFNVLRTTLQKVYKKHGWNFEALSEMLRLDRIEQIEHDNQESKSTKVIRTKVTFFEWNSKIPIDLFYSDVKEYFKLKSLKELYYFFQYVVSDFSISLKPDLLLHFIILFDKLYYCESKIILIKGNKGVLAYLQKHLKPTTGAFPKKDFRKLKHELKKRKDEYDLIERSVNKAFARYLD